MNPITTFISNSMEAPATMVSEMKDRVAEASISAQRIVDERHGPHHYHKWFAQERRQREFDHVFVAHSSLKAHPEAGCRSSFKTARYYVEQSAKRRDELLAKVHAAQEENK